MKIVSYLNLLIIQNYKVIIKSPMKFSSVIDCFVIPFSLNAISDKIKFQAIVTDLYKLLNIDDLLKI